MESYDGKIPQAATKAKNDKTIEENIGVGIGRFTLGTHQQGFTKRLGTYLGYTDRRQIEHML